MTLPDRIELILEKRQDCSKGENPPSRGAFYDIRTINGQPIYGGGQTFRQHYGDELSFNNVWDTLGGYSLIQPFMGNERLKTAIAVKHAKYSGIGRSLDPVKSCAYAHLSDPQADFGANVTLGFECDAKVAEFIANMQLIDLLSAPGYSEEALEILKTKGQKRKRKIIEFDSPSNESLEIRLKEATGLVQDKPDYLKKVDRSRIDVVSDEKPSYEDSIILAELLDVVRWVESNGIVVGNGRVEDGQITDLYSTGFGSFRKRVGAVKIALFHPKLELTYDPRAKGSYLASDGFFPFPDNITQASKAGIKHIISCKGALREKKVIKRANKYKMTLSLTDDRLFKH